MKKFLLLTIISIALGATVGLALTYFEGAKAAENCQYPNRPLVNGNCDNSDPAVPECTKAANEAECIANYTGPQPQPVDTRDDTQGHGKIDVQTKPEHDYDPAIYGPSCEGTGK